MFGEGREIHGVASAFLKEPHTERRPSEVKRAVRHQFPSPPEFEEHKILENIFQHLYWSIRTLQFKACYKIEGRMSFPATIKLNSSNTSPIVLDTNDAKNSISRKNIIKAKPPKVLINDDVNIPLSSTVSDLQNISEMNKSVQFGTSNTNQLTANGNRILKFGKSVSQEFFSISLTEADASSLCDLSKLEPVEWPPTLTQLRELTQNRLSDNWIKYMYAKFKNECPNGRMNFAVFKQILGIYVPDRISDAYLERLFQAFCTSSSNDDQLTFKDLIVCLATYCDLDARKNAEWTMRLINFKNHFNNVPGNQIKLADFVEFVKSVFLLVGRGVSQRKQVEPAVVKDNKKKTNRKIKLSEEEASKNQRSHTLSTVFIVEKSTLTAINKRAVAIFKELDVNNKGYLTVDNLEKLFQTKEFQILQSQ